MLLSKISVVNKSCFCANKDDVNKKTGEYIDPLMNWPIRGAAFTNEVGEALRPLIGEYATLSWVPALLYIGADIYDKYKNDQTEYNPNSRRGLQQAIFQGLASIFLPLVAVKSGQNIFSLIGKTEKHKLTFNAKEHIINLAQEFVANGKMRAYKHNDNDCINDFVDIVKNNMDYKTQKEETTNLFSKCVLWTKNKLKISKNINNQDNIKNFAQETINELINLRKDLLNINKTENNNKWHNEFKLAKEAGQTKNVAVKSVLNDYLQNKMLKGKIIKTIGGFIALGIAIKPIDHFVEDILIKKWLAPKFDKKKSA